MTTASERALVDTNVLIYAYFKDNAQSADSLRLLETAHDGEADLCVAPQNLAEFFAVATGRRISEPMTVDEAVSAVNEILSLPGMVLLMLPLDVVQRWSELATATCRAGTEIYDLQLAATMQGNGISRIYTYNEVDFRDLPGITVLTP